MSCIFIPESILCTGITVDHFGYKSPRSSIRRQYQDSFPSEFISAERIISHWKWRVRSLIAWKAAWRVNNLEYDQPENWQPRADTSEYSDCKHINSFSRNFKSNVIHSLYYLRSTIVTQQMNTSFKKMTTVPRLFRSQIERWIIWTLTSLKTINQ